MRPSGSATEPMEAGAGDSVVPVILACATISDNTQQEVRLMARPTRNTTAFITLYNPGYQRSAVFNVRMDRVLLYHTTAQP